jgi:hypothetical protein
MLLPLPKKIAHVFSQDFTQEESERVRVLLNLFHEKGEGLFYKNEDEALCNACIIIGIDSIVGNEQ